MADSSRILIGRGADLAVLDELLDSARSGRSGVLVIHGEAGVGKTALVRAAVESAHDFQVISVAGVEAEIALGFAALHRLLGPLLDRMSALPPVQRRAIEAAFGLSDGVAADRFLLGLAVLTLISAAASTQPTLVIVDDAQWIDRESLEVISFVGRRLHADRVALLIAMRDALDGSSVLPEGLPSRRVAALDVSDVRTLLALHAPTSVSDDVAARVATETEGLPLAIIELSGELTDEQLTGRDALPDTLPVGARLERHFLTQVRALTDDAQKLLLVAAAESSGDRALVRSAGHSLGLSVVNAEEAIERSGLLVWNPVVAFRHPLVRSAVYSAASASERRNVHHGLAGVIDATVDPDRHAWHRAAAAPVADEDIANELERSADNARTRGGFAAEATLRTRAAELTPSSHERGRRFLAAAEAHITAGAFDAATELVGRAGALVEGPVDRAEALRLEATLDCRELPGNLAAPLLSAARMLESTDAQAARALYAEAIAATSVSYQLTKGTTPAEIATAALDASRPAAHEYRTIDLLLDGFATRMAVGYSESVPLLRGARDRLASAATETEGMERWALFVGHTALELWDEEPTYALLRRSEARDRATGALVTLRVHLDALAHFEMWRGRFDAAEACHAECVDISAAMGGNARGWRRAAVELSAWRGDDVAARKMAGWLLGPDLEAAGAGIAANSARMALIVLGLAEGRYREAFDTASAVFDIDPPSQGNQVLPDVVEAAVRCGEHAAASSALERLAERAAVASTPWALGLLARSDALLAPDEDAEKLYRAALDYLHQTNIGTEQARTHLLFGEWLRRQRDRTEARKQLSIALDMFDTMGAKAFAQRSERELSATGARARRRSVETANDLTPREAQIAQYAAIGATNTEIAAQLFLSPATVDYHLRKVYRKLGITSRREIARATNRDTAGRDRSSR